ncbi:hypothetical protein XELAEV_18039452mg [Xenopus laevis]|uniref:Uncharacterized protein n=1 Tax=Xenopus laevis TaxID=8355 RepID=A0A974C7U7_XENLA|nr:hypothetical protein XELAEV_18039452mg [Xenopus laevis]
MSTHYCTYLNFLWQRLNRLGVKRINKTTEYTYNYTSFQCSIYKKTGKARPSYLADDRHRRIVSIYRPSFQVKATVWYKLNNIRPRQIKS